jgi:hydantoinase/carbamoylase family amidase
VNADRLWETIHHTAQWGDSRDGGVKRLTLTDEDQKVRTWFAETLGSLGCTVTVDQMGNMFAVRPGLDDSLPPIAMGSHLDTQPAGGRFDGILGVLGGVEVMRVLHENDHRTQAPLAVVNWTNEEGARYNIGMLGSGVWTGLIDIKDAYACTDADGKTFGDELKRIGFLGARESSFKATPLSAHFELHIEQGPVLEDSGKALGVVTGVQAMGWTYVTVNGHCQHAGTAPMDRRSDALLAACQMVSEINAMARELSGMSTVGVFNSEPSSPGTVPGKVRFSVDLEHLDTDTRLEMVRRTKEICGNIAQQHNACQVEFEDTWDSEGVRFDPKCIDTVREVARELVGEDSYVELPAGAGHDSVNTSFHFPTSMIFIPSQNGVSHHPSEWSTPDQW